LQWVDSTPPTCGQSSQLLEHLARELSDLGLTHGEIDALAALTPGVAVTVAGLQAATGQRASTMTGVLDRLERRGLVERALNPEDRRSFTVGLTDAGGAAAVPTGVTGRLPP
jgi:MarR family transcriptional regulator, organic hydroperoxide resistance regulator